MSSGTTSPTRATANSTATTPPQSPRTRQARGTGAGLHNHTLPYIFCTSHALCRFSSFPTGGFVYHTCHSPGIGISSTSTQIPPVKSCKSPLSNFVLAGAICRIIVTWLKMKIQNPGQSKRRNLKRKRSKHLGLYCLPPLVIAVAEEAGSPVFLTQRVALLCLVRHNKSNER